MKREENLQILNVMTMREGRVETKLNEVDAIVLISYDGESR